MTTHLDFKRKKWSAIIGIVAYIQNRSSFFILDVVVAHDSLLFTHSWLLLHVEIVAFLFIDSESEIKVLRWKKQHNTGTCTISFDCIWIPKGNHYIHSFIHPCFSGSSQFCTFSLSFSLLSSFGWKSVENQNLIHIKHLWPTTDYYWTHAMCAHAHLFIHFAFLIY